MEKGAAVTTKGRPRRGREVNKEEEGEKVVEVKTNGDSCNSNRRTRC